jgi:predicted DNA-binding protein
MKSTKKPLQVYLTDEQKKKLKQLADKEGLTMSGYIVDMIRRKK